MPGFPRASSPSPRPPPLLHIPYDEKLLHELNAERCELAKTGRLLFNHPEGTRDDRFWAPALSVLSHESDRAAQKPIAKT